jgi:hypothetical protein
VANLAMMLSMRGEGILPALLSKQDSTLTSPTGNPSNHDTGK